MPTLLDLVSGLEPALLRSLVAIRVELRGGRATARLSFSLFTASARRADERDLPAAVALIGRERWPDLEREVATGTPMPEQLRALQASGLVGTLDVARFRPADPAAARAAGSAPVAWVVKTRAGTDRWA